MEVADRDPKSVNAKGNGTKVKFGVAGCGHIGKRHAQMIYQNPDAELAACCDIIPRDSLDLPAYQRMSFFPSLDEMLASQHGLDVVNICTPNGLHAAMALKVLKAGCHVVIEKPMALNQVDAENILLTAERNKRMVFCVMQNRYSPPSVWIKEMVDSGRLGEIYFVQVNCFWNRDERYYKHDNWHGSKELDGGTLFTQFSHFVDLMYWLFGDVSDIRSRFFDFAHQKLTDFEDTGVISFRFKRGGLGTLQYSTAVWDKNLESSITIIAEHGSVKIGGQYMNEVEYCHVKDYVLPVLPPTNPGNDYGAYKGSAQNHHFVIDNVVDVLSGKGVCVTTNAFEGYKVVDIIRRMYDLD